MMSSVSHTGRCFVTHAWAKYPPPTHTAYASKNPNGLIKIPVFKPNWLFIPVAAAATQFTTLMNN